MNREKTATEVQMIRDELEHLALRISWVDVTTNDGAQLKEYLLQLVYLVRQLQ